MKRGFVVSYMISALLIVVYSVGMLACPAHAAVNPIEVTVDPRIELLSAVQLLSKYGGRQKKTSYSFRYKQEMADYFTPYKHHRAVSLYDRMFPRFFSYDAPPTLMLYLSDPPALKPQWEFQSNVRRIADQHGGGVEGAESMMEFVDALRDFARDSDFQRFYAAHQHTYRTMIRETESKLGRVDIVGPVEDYYGRTESLRYMIVLAPLFHPGGYGPMLERADGVQELYNICGPVNVKRGSPVFGDASHIRSLAWHEFGHSFVNPLADEYWSSLVQYSSLYNPISSAMQRQAYGTWKICINEHIVRAVQARIIFRVEGVKASQKFMDRQRNRGFAYVKPLCERLEDYEKHRDRYPTLQSFYPQLVEVFKSLQEQDLGPEFYRVSVGEFVLYRFIEPIALIYLHKPDVLAIILSFIAIPPTISAIWAYRDSRKRGKRSLPAVLLVLFGIWPLGLITWLFLRRRSVRDSKTSVTTDEM